MPAKPLVFRLVLFTFLALTFAVRSPAAPAPATLVLFPRTLAKDDDVRALVDIRKHLRSDTPYDVITYDPNSAAVKRAAADSAHPEWLTDPMGNDPERLALTRALGAQFYVVIAKSDNRGKMDTRLGEAADSVRTWSAYDQKGGDAAKFVQQQVGSALANPMAPPPAPVPPAPVPAAPSNPSIPTPAPVTPTVPVPPPAAPPVIPAPVTPAPVIPAPVTPAPVVPIPPAAPAPVPIPLPASAPPATVPAPPSTVPVTPPPPTVPAPLPSPAKPILPKPAAPAPPAHTTFIVPSPLPIPAPSQIVITPPPAPAAANPDDLLSVRKTLGQGDDALAIGNFVAAIAAYRDAINGAPLSVEPRLKLAQAYGQSGLRDKALSEAQRALQIAPGNSAIQQFLMQLDAETGSSDGAVARFTAQASQNPQDAAAHLELADALWNNGALSQAEGEYHSAQTLAANQPQTAQAAASHLARLLAAQSRYEDSLAALQNAGAGGYALALGIVQSRADTLRSSLSAAQGSFDAGKSTHEAFYKTVTDAAAQSQSLADFVVKVTPPPAFKVSHLHRVLATHLLAQQAAVLVTYVETADAGLAEQATRLDKEAQTEMLTAHAAEQELGLWNAPRAAARD